MFRQRDQSILKDHQEYIIKLAFLAEIKEWDNRSHLERVRRYTSLIAAGLGLPQDQAEVISIACQLHDVGKITIPDVLLKKTGKYDEAEWRAIERHTIEGALILKGSANPIFQVGETIAFTHHERWDGSGYPQGLAGEEIPLASRICAIVDVFDGLTTRRLYKEPIDENESFRLIRHSGGTLFDPRLVQAFDACFPEILKIKQSVRV